MRILAVALILVAFAVIPQPAAANHDSSDSYVTVPGAVATLYIDDSFPPMIFSETNGISGLQRGFDNSGHLGHPSPDQRIF